MSPSFFVIFSSLSLYMLVRVMKVILIDIFYCW